MTTKTERDTKKFNDKNQRILKSVKRGVYDAINEFGLDMEKKIKRQIILLNLVWTRKLYNSIKWTRGPKGGTFQMASYAEELDSGPVRRIVVTREMKLWSWTLGGRHGPAKRGVHETVKQKVRAGRPITVSPHPFLLQPINSALKVLPKTLNKHIGKVMGTENKKVA